MTEVEADTEIVRLIVRLNEVVGAIMLDLNRPGHTEEERHQLSDKLTIARQRLYLARQRRTALTKRQSGRGDGGAAGHASTR